MDDWDAFPDAPDEGSDPWAAFPDAKPRKSRDRKPKLRSAIKAGTELEAPKATDGDTIRAEQGPVRLVGVDAPELGQLGWNALGGAVPIGQQSQNALASFLGQGPVATGHAFGTSFGRTVAPVSVRNDDAGRTLLRYGNALAAPEYLASDPERLGQYNQDERLARLNGLGLHDTFAQTPAEHRADPDYVPDRETVARFWDSPTGIQGLPADKEAQLVQLYKTGTADQINAFLAANGYETSRPEDLAAFIAKRDAGAKADPSVTYRQAPPLMIDSGEGAGGAVVRKAASGFLAGGLDELGAVVDTLGGTDGRESVWNSERRLADIWANNQRQNAGILAYDQTNHPIASTSAEVGGALASGFVLPFGAGARTVPQLAKVGAAWGGAEGFLGTDGTLTDRLKGAVVGAPVGAIADPALGKAVEAIAPVVLHSAIKLRNRAGGAPAGAGEASARVGADIAPDAAPGGNPADPWADFPDAEPERVIGMDAEPAESLSSDPLANPQVQSLIAAGADDGMILAVLKQQGLPVPPLGAVARARAMLDPATQAERLAAAERVQPGDVLPLASNEIDGPDEAAAIDAGRFGEAKPIDERTYLERQSVPGLNGPVPKVGPVDMVGFLRTAGGLRLDEGGELRHMGLSNAARRDLDLVGQETRFGPLIHDQGMDLDDAALAAWEAGYFPELNERPDINTFLDALRATHDGTTGRRFRAEDQPQVEAFDMARQERYDLEQRIADGPIWQDRSSQGDDAEPFPPLQAYEEWPSDAITRVGNIDVGKLDTPQDIRRALKSSYNAMGGFDAATRGRITQAETERLASELGMTPDKLLARRKGEAFNAEEALAARQILSKSSNELVNAARKISRLDNPGDEALAEFRQKWMRHVAIQEQVSGMTAEAGRALQQFRQAANAKAIRGDVLSALVRAGGGRTNLQDAATALLDAVEMGPGKFNVLAEKASKPKWKDKISELYINMLLSNPPTHVVNMVSNTITAVAQIPEHAAAAVVGASRRAVMGKAARERVLASEVGARAFGLVQGAKEGFHLFGKALRTGEADDFVSKVEGDEFRAISGLKGEVIRIPTRLLTAEDQLFKGIARRMELNAQAVRIAHKEGLKGEARESRIAELVADPTDEMLERALDYGRYLTFQRKLGDFGQGVSRITGSNLLAKVVVPFVRTPINLMKFATERSPAAPILKEWRAEFAAGGASRDLAIAKVLLGSGLATMMYQAAQDGVITGAVPPDPKKARLMFADGWQPYSIKVGDRYVSYSRLDPLSTTIGVAADMATLPEGLSDKQRDDQATMLVASIMGNLASKTWLSGVSSFVEGLADPGRYAEGWLERTAGAFAVPAGVAGLARAIDPVARKREGVGEAIQARVPGMTDELLPRRDVFGEVVPLDSLGPDFLSPFWQTKSKSDPVIAEMLRIEKGVSAPGKTFTEDGEKIDYTPEQYDRYHEIAGRLTYNGLLGLIGSESYQQMPDQAKRKAASKAIKKARESARAVLGDKSYPLPARGAASDAVNDDWSGFPDDPTAPAAPATPVDPWADFPDASQRDVMAELKSAIPGIRFTSGYRDPAYNASLRARGYNPSDNSEHLDASALDMLPPPGKSLGWLKSAVRRYDPKARLLVHDGHLHGGFDGYFNAPKLGGMAGR